MGSRTFSRRLQPRHVRLSCRSFSPLIPRNLASPTTASRNSPDTHELPRVLDSLRKMSTDWPNHFRRSVQPDTISAKNITIRHLRTQYTHGFFLSINLYLRSWFLSIAKLRLWIQIRRRYSIAKHAYCHQEVLIDLTLIVNDQICPSWSHNFIRGASQLELYYSSSSPRPWESWYFVRKEEIIQGK